MDYETFKRAAIRGQDEIVVCPYNPSHVLTRSRMQYHLVKCSKQHGGQELVKCPYNATHRILKSELQQHVSECPERRLFEAEKYKTQEDLNEKGKVSNFVQPDLPPSEENWDEDEVKTSYNPQNHLNDKLILRNLQGATKAERKRFRMEERRRVNQLALNDNGDKEIVPTGNSPLRLPRVLPSEMASARLGMGRGVSVSKSPALDRSSNDNS